MAQIAHKEKAEYVVLPRTIWQKRAPQRVPSLRALREAITRAWKGHSAVEEIRTQRRK